MKGSRKIPSSETIKELKARNELAVRGEVSPVIISSWNNEFIENSAVAFETLRVETP